MVKGKIRASFLSLLVFAFFNACSSSGGSSSSSVPISDKTVPYAYDSSKPTFDIADTTKTVMLTGAKGKKIYLAKYNLNESSTPANDIRVLESADGVESLQSIGRAGTVGANARQSQKASADTQYSHSLLWAWKPDSQKSVCGVQSSGTRANSSINPLIVDITQITPEAGTTTKDLYIPIDENDETVYFYKMTFVARAVGEHCIVWAPAATQSDEAKASQKYMPVKCKQLINLPDKCAGVSTFTDAMAEELKDKFEAAYPYEKVMFGDKATEIFRTHDYKNNLKVAIEKVSDTAAYTNIVVYDFKDSSNQKGAVGYFWNKDYRPSYKTLYGKEREWDGETFPYYYSNEGNYIYIAIHDIVFGSEDEDKRDWVQVNENGGSPIICNPDSYLTLCHEYMHSLQYSRKCIEHDFSNWSVALGELLGTLCEDVMKDVLEVPPSYSVENYRLAEFCNKHFFSSVMDDNRNLSYANLLAFGIYLTRNYGGAKLVGDMVTNTDSGDWSCITTAIRNVNGESKTPEQLMKEFLEQLLWSESVYTSNKDSDPMTVGDKNFTMKAINMKDLSEWFGYELENIPEIYTATYDFYQQVKKGVKTYDAKDIIREETVAGENVYDIRPRGGFNLHYIGKASEDSVKLVFSDAVSGAAHPKMMLVVGD